ncbi:hypothetical protein [Microbacterium timonense]|uniref:hypothetical protein n=1 Tax=Microbacterium timonense TaxID=2086576 RepID=UPI000D101664|nr:hypothetical protein [Microbacterium timonense]
MQGPRRSAGSAGELAEPEQLAEADELALLRRRAYGPDADIGGDEAAQARLAELEDIHRRRLDRAAPPAADSADPPRPAPAALDMPVSGRPPTVAAPARLDRADDRRRRRPRWTLRAGAVAALALVAAQAASLAGSPVEPVPTAAAAGTAADVVLLRVPGGGEPADPHATLDRLGLAADQLRRYESLDGLAVWGGRSRFGTMCLLVADPAKGIGEGTGAEGCAPYGAMAPAELLVSDSSSGGLIRLVLQSDHVDVYVYGPPQRAPLSP